MFYVFTYLSDNLKFSFALCNKNKAEWLKFISPDVFLLCDK